MYSTLAAQADDAGLVEISETKAATLCWQHRSQPHLLLVRDPIDRVLSAWRDKLQVQPREFGGPGFVGWQRSQMLVLRRLGKHDAPGAERAQALLDLPLADFLAMLPHLRLLDGHFRPQHLRRAFRLKGLLPFAPGRVTECLRIEELDAAEIAERFGLDIGMRRNVTSEGQREVLADADLQIIEKVYRRDFELFGYSSV